MSSSILLVLSTGAAILAVLAPFPDFWRIYKTRSTGSVSVLPVVLIFCNCYVCGELYPSAFCGNSGFGMLASIVFGGIFNYHWTRDHARIHKLYGAAFYVLSGYTLYYSLGTSGATNQSSEAVENTLGAVCGLINLALYASPLETIKNVFETKDASTIPITISAFFLANGIVWEVHSIAEDDMLVRDRSRVVCRPSSAVRGVLSSQDNSLAYTHCGLQFNKFYIVRNYEDLLTLGYGKCSRRILISIAVIYRHDVNSSK